MTQRNFRASCLDISASQNQVVQPAKTMLRMSLHVLICAYLTWSIASRSLKHAFLSLSVLCNYFKLILNSYVTFILYPVWTSLKSPSSRHCGFQVSLWEILKQLQHTEPSPRRSTGLGVFTNPVGKHNPLRMQNTHFPASGHVEVSYSG